MHISLKFKIQLLPLLQRQQQQKASKSNFYDEGQGSVGPLQLEEIRLPSNSDHIIGNHTFHHIFTRYEHKGRMEGTECKLSLMATGKWS